MNGTVVPFDSPAGRALREREITEAVDALSNANTTVVLITTPTVAWEGWGAVMIEDPKRSVNNPDWIALWNESIRNVARSHPDSTAVIDLNEEITPNNAFVTEIDGIVFRMFDGLHITRGGRQAAAANWIWSEIDGFLESAPGWQSCMRRQIESCCARAASRGVLGLVTNEHVLRQHIVGEFLDSDIGEMHTIAAQTFLLGLANRPKPSRVINPCCVDA